MGMLVVYPLAESGGLCAYEHWNLVALHRTRIIRKVSVLGEFGLSVNHTLTQREGCFRSTFELISY